ncbi:LysR substrate-binding domain-containing protein [Riemerella columbina]|uniref:LysR substrate-binding domain-containing protein n=1 Tax=Riemerella columbina TaxID=103810 RepID=UPI000375B846|nr:LysR substrate-binding domain-containing protein [Riemerella columbina]
MNTRQFDYILAIDEFKSFGEAADRCFITQSTLSTMVKRFEDEIGINIFDRKTKPITTTKEGRLLIDQIKIIRREIKVLDELTLQIKGEVSGELIIGIIPTVAPYLLPLFLGDFSNQFPNINIIVEEMMTHDIQKSLKNGSIDIGIIAIPIHDSELIETEIYQEPFLLFDCHSETIPQQVDITEVDYDNFILLQDGHCLRMQVEQICQLSKNKSQGMHNLQFKAGSIDSLIRFTKANKGVTILPYLSTLDLRAEDKARLAQFNPPYPVRSIGVVTHQHFVKKKVLKALIQTMAKSITSKIPKTSEMNIVKPYI